MYSKTYHTVWGVNLGLPDQVGELSCHLTCKISAAGCPTSTGFDHPKTGTSPRAAERTRCRASTCHSTTLPRLQRPRQHGPHWCSKLPPVSLTATQSISRELSFQTPCCTVHPCFPERISQPNVPPRRISSLRGSARHKFAAKGTSQYIVL